MSEFVIMPKEHYQGACDAIREKTGGTDLIVSGDMESSIRGIQSGGIENPKVMTFNYLGGITNIFYNYTFPDGCEEIVIDVENPLRPEFGNAFREIKNIKKIIIRVKNIDPTVTYDLGNTFIGSSDLEEIDLSGLEAEDGVYISSFSYSFCECKSLKKIIGTLNLSRMTNVWAYNGGFVNVSSLEEIRFAKNSIARAYVGIYSHVLSDESIQSIIDGLMDLTDSETITINLSQTVKNKLTEEQIATITAKNWTLA